MSMKMKMKNEKKSIISIDYKYFFLNFVKVSRSSKLTQGRIQK